MILLIEDKLLTMIYMYFDEVICYVVPKVLSPREKSGPPMHHAFKESHQGMCWGGGFSTAPQRRLHL